jgi:hypothetical protein
MLKRIDERIGTERPAGAGVAMRLVGERPVDRFGYEGIPVGHQDQQGACADRRIVLLAADSGAR